MKTFAIDSDRVAELEGEGWRAYYDHNWPRMLSLMIRINREQFRMPLPAALLAAYYTVQAGRAWAPPNVDRDRTHYFLTRFYRHARAHSALSFDPARAGDEEMAYWEVHRSRRAGAPHGDYVRTLTALHSTLFGLSPDQASESAEWRTKANEIVIDITNGTAAGPEASWKELKDCLRRCYDSVNREMSA